MCNIQHTSNHVAWLLHLDTVLKAKFALLVQNLKCPSRFKSTSDKFMAYGVRRGHSNWPSPNIKTTSDGSGHAGVCSDRLENARTWFNVTSGSINEGFAARSTLTQLISKIKYKMLQAWGSHSRDYNITVFWDATRLTWYAVYSVSEVPTAFILTLLRWRWKY
jgi:hypothetical protein